MIGMQEGQRDDIVSICPPARHIIRRRVIRIITDGVETLYARAD